MLNAGYVKVCSELISASRAAVQMDNFHQIGHQSDACSTRVNILIHVDVAKEMKVVSLCLH